MKKDDLILVTKGNSGGIRAIGQVTGAYKFAPQYAQELGLGEDYEHCREVNWLWHDNDETIPNEKLLNKNVSQRTIYGINSIIIEENLEDLISSRGPKTKRNYVLKIDEINRGNTAQIFGELITLIEEDKRGESVTLASGDKLSIPDNLYIVGTMNTADRSLTHLDTALRRRFHFIEMPPCPEVLENKQIGKIDLSEFLIRLNERMESQLGKDCTIGHAYFMQNGDPIETAEQFKNVIFNKIIPQLQEYFYDDYEQINMILGDIIVPKKELSTLPKRFNSTTKEVFHIATGIEASTLIQAIGIEFEFIQSSDENNDE
jgi:5-methylcytosine-specific restriction protein B